MQGIAWRDWLVFMVGAQVHTKNAKKRTLAWLGLADFTFTPPGRQGGGRRQRITGQPIKKQSLGIPYKGAFKKGWESRAKAFKTSLPCGFEGPGAS